MSGREGFCGDSYSAAPIVKLQYLSERVGSCCGGFRGFCDSGRALARGWLRALGADARVVAVADPGY
jgi:hypothetical protein